MWFGVFFSVSGIPEAQRNDESPIEVNVEAKAQWRVLRREGFGEILPPLPLDNTLLRRRPQPPQSPTDPGKDCWLAQVEIVTCFGPARRLWMGPQFIFKTYKSNG